MDDSQSIFDDPEEPSSGVSTTSLSLLIRAQRHDDTAWRRLVVLYSPMVFHWCLKEGVRPSDVDDVLQEIFLGVARNLPQFRGLKASGSFRGWLRGISGNKIKDYFRAHRIEQDIEISKEPWLLNEALSVEEVDALEAEEQQAILLRAVALIEQEFPPKMWKAFWDTYILGRNPSDVAEELGVTRNMIYLAKSRIRHRLKVEFDDLLS